MGGLLVYLVGPGREGTGEVHREPHLVAGNEGVMLCHGGEELDRSAALEIAQELDGARALTGVRVTQPVYEFIDDADDIESGGGVAEKVAPKRVKVSDRDADVWHCSLSLPPEEPALTDERWAEVSEQLVERMGFSDPDGVKAPCRWAAVRHGVSPKGNDHVHLVVSLVHEDGTKADVHDDRGRAQRIAGELEREHGLQVLESRSIGRGTPGYDRVDRARAEKQDAHEPVRARLARTVRGCAAAAGDEADFVRRLRDKNVKVRPRYAEGRGDVVVGYSVAQRPAESEQPVWYGGGRLARDLTLPRLRSDWPDTPGAASAGAAAWQAADRGQPQPANQRQGAEPDAALWDQCTEELGALADQLRTLDPNDHAGWALGARDAAGAFAAWSLQVEPDAPGPLADAADTLARSAALRSRHVEPRRAGAASAKGAALVLSSIAHHGQGTVAQTAMLRQLWNTAKALSHAHTATGDARRAREIRLVMQGQVRQLHDRMPQPEATPDPIAADPQATEAARLARTGQLPARAPSSPLPAPLEGPSPKPRAPAPERQNDMQR